MLRKGGSDKDGLIIKNMGGLTVHRILDGVNVCLRGGIGYTAVYTLRYGLYGRAGANTARIPTRRDLVGALGSKACIRVTCRNACLGRVESR
jgi:hypothetical protein